MPFPENHDTTSLRPERSRARRSRALSDDVYEALVARLITLKLPPGEHLSMDALARQLEVSQTPVRAALIRLQSEGLVTRKHNTGFSIAPLPSARQFREVYLMRSLLEPEVASLAAENARTRDVQKLEELCTRMRQAATTADDSHGLFAILDGQFHAYLAEVSDNDHLRQTLSALHAHMHLFRLKQHTAVTSEAIKEHEIILKAIRSRDSAAAKSAMATHIRRSSQRLKPCYEELGEPD